MRWSRAIWAAVWLLGGMAWGQAAQAQKPPAPLEAPSATLPAHLSQKAERPQLRLPSRGLAAAAKVAVPRIVLPPLSEAERQSLQNKPSTEKRTRVGVVRELKFSPAEQGARAELGDGSEVWMLEVVSTGAAAVRLHITGFDLPEGAKLYLASMDGSGEVHEFSGKGPWGTGEFWTPIYDGEGMRLELVAAQASTAKFQVRKIGHVMATKPEAQVVQGCHLDAVCYPAWDTASRSVARIQFNDQQFVYSCSAALLNNSAQDLSPLLLTAYHCVDTEDLAKTVRANWGYRSVSCNSTGTTGSGLTMGARLLAGAAGPDSTLLELLGSLPSSVHYAGWKLELPALNDPITGIHHPAGEHQRISFGNVRADLPTREAYHHVGFTEGMGEPGSSGSPLFNAAGQVLGQLWGGDASCGNQAGTVLYGKLSVAHPFLKNAEGRNFLEQGLPDDAFAPNFTRAEARLLTQSGTHDLVLKAAHEDWYKVSLPPNKHFSAAISTATTADAYIELFREIEQQPIMNGYSRQPTSPPFPAWVTNLDVPREYYLRVVTVNGSGQFKPRMMYSMDVKISDPAPLEFGTLQLSPSGHDRIDPGIYVDAKYFPFEAWFEWSTSGGFEQYTETARRNVSPTGALSFVGMAVTQLQPNTRYYFQLAATNSTGTYRSGVASAVTGSIPPLQNLSPSPQFPAQHRNVRLSWSAPYATRYEVFFGKTSPPPFLAEVPAVLPHQFAGYDLPNEMIEPLTTYHWKVIAHYADGTQQAAATSFSTLSPAISTPSVLFTQPLVVGRQSQPGTAIFMSRTDIPVELDSYAVEGDFFVTSNNCPMSFVGGTWRCSFEVRFRPTGPGTRTGAIKFFYQGFTATTPLSGIGVDFELTLSRPTRPSRSGSPGSSTQEYVVHLAGTPGWEETASFQCSAPRGLGCTVSPKSLPLSSAGSVKLVVTAPSRSQRLRSKSEQTVIVKVHATVQGVTKTIDVPVQLQR